MYRACLFVFLLFLPGLLLAQYSKQACQWIKVDGQSYPLDSLSVVSETITASDPKVIFDYDINTGMLKVDAATTNLDSILLCYDVFPFAFHQEYFHRTLENQYDSNALGSDPIVSNEHLFRSRDELFSTDSLQKNGSITRGISFGNSQNVFVNSSLNLQLDGKLTDDLNIRAAINDQNIPFQPEGNTQQLQEFDKVFIQLYNDNVSLTAGDIVMQNRENHFMRYYKNVQGGLLDVNYKVSEKSKAETSIGIAVGKGKFASILVEALEGVQGPYRLRGPNNERFIVVLAASEKVYLDGILLKRGFDFDYVIDYNLAEVTFTNRVIITKFSRLRIDFEYSEQNYNRTVFSASHRQNLNKKINFFFDAYSEKDNEKNPILFDLNASERAVLNTIGDSVNLAAISGVDSTSFNLDRILYKKIDTLDLGGNPVQNIYVNSINPDSAAFNISFSEVGFGNGDYILLSTTANGRVYQWVSPTASIKQGSYSPVIVVPLPIKKQLIVAGADYSLSKNDRFFIEGAFSNQDINLFSNLGNDDNTGYGLKLGYETKDKKIFFLKGYSFSAGIDYEYNAKDFRPIDRFRYVEFDRDWSIDPALQENRFNENITTLQLELEKDADNHFKYQLINRNRGAAVNGFQHTLNAKKELGKIKNNFDFFAMNNDGSTLNATWYRLQFETQFKNKLLVPGYSYSLDRNEVRYRFNDSLATAMNYEQHQFYVQSSDSVKLKFRLEHSYREDFAPVGNEFSLNNQASTTNLNFNTSLDNRQRLDLRFTYREIKNLDKIGKDRREETAMGRLDWMGLLFKNTIRNELTYSISNGRELKREFIFLEVPTGEGTHAWRDLNEDGIQDLNEFFEAINYDERNYAKIFVPTDEYLTAFSLILNYRIHLNAPKAWRSEKGIRKFLSKISNNSSWSVNNKTTDAGLNARLNPLANGIEAEDLISARESLRSALFYNRADPKFGLNANVLRTEFKQLLTNGFETRLQDKMKVGVRWSPQRETTFRINYEVGNDLTSSDFLHERNYTIDSKKISPEITWQPSNKFRLTGFYSFKEKTNILFDNAGENSSFNEVKLEMRMSKVSSSTLTMDFSYINIAFDGKENSALGYVLLEALRPGQNLRWSLNWQQKLFNGLQLNLNYDGRKSEGSRLVNVGRVQVSALF